MLLLIGATGTLAVCPAGAQEQVAAAPAGPAAAPRKPAAAGAYFIEFRAAELGVYGHSYIVFGRLGPGGRPTSTQYADFHPEGGTLGLAVGHAVPVAADMTPEKETLTLPISSSFRRTITAAQYRQVLETIKRVHANNRVWSALAYNCNTFVGDVAESIGMKAPTSLLFSTAYIPALRALNEPEGGPTATPVGQTTRRAAPARSPKPTPARQPGSGASGPAAAAPMLATPMAGTMQTSAY